MTHERYQNAEFCRIETVSRLWDSYTNYNTENIYNVIISLRYLIFKVCTLIQTFHFLNILEELSDVSTKEFLHIKLLLTALKAYFSYYSAYSSQLNDSNRLSDKIGAHIKDFQQALHFYLEIHNVPLPYEKKITESSCYPCRPAAELYGFSLFIRVWGSTGGMFILSGCKINTYHGIVCSQERVLNRLSKYRMWKMLVENRTFTTI